MIRTLYAQRVQVYSIPHDPDIPVQTTNNPDVDMAINALLMSAGLTPAHVVNVTVTPRPPSGCNPMLVDIWVVCRI